MSGLECDGPAPSDVDRRTAGGVAAGDGFRSVGRYASLLESAERPVEAAALLEECRAGIPDGFHLARRRAATRRLARLRVRLDEPEHAARECIEGFALHLELVAATRDDRSAIVAMASELRDRVTTMDLGSRLWRAIACLANRPRTLGPDTPSTEEPGSLFEGLGDAESAAALRSLGRQVRATEAVDQVRVRGVPRDVRAPGAP